MMMTSQSKGLRFEQTTSKYLIKVSMEFSCSKTAQMAEMGANTHSDSVRSVD